MVPPINWYLKWPVNYSHYLFNIYIYSHLKKIVIQRPCLSYIFMLQPPFTTIKPALYSNVSWFSMNKTGSNQLTIPAPLGGPLPAASGLYFCVHWEHTGDLCELKQRPKRSVKSGVQKLHLCTVYMITGVYIYIFVFSITYIYII